MNRGLNPFDLLLAGTLFVLLDLRRNGLDLLPNVLGFILLLAGILALRPTATGRDEARYLTGAAGGCALGTVLSIPFLSVAGARAYVLPAAPVLSLDGTLAWGSLAATGLANGLLLLALEARVRRLGGNARFERGARAAALLNLAAPLAGLALEALLAPRLAAWHSQGAVGLALTLLGTFSAGALYWRARVLGGGPRPGPQQAPVTAGRWR